MLQRLCINKQRLFYNSFKYFSNKNKNEKDELIEKFTKIHSRKQDKCDTRKPAYPYDDILSIETPSLLLNLQELINNIKDNNNNLIRPNSNIHKSTDIIQLQLKYHKERMNGILCETVNEAELLINSATNRLFLNNNDKIQNILLSNICIDLSKQWRFIELYDNTSGIIMKLSTFIDDIFQIHLWNYTIDQFKKTNQNILNKHTSSNINLQHESNNFGLGIMIILNKYNQNDIQSLKEIINIINTEYSNNLYLRGFYIKNNNENIKNWLFNKENQKELNIEKYFDNLFIGNINEMYDDEYIFNNDSLTILSTILNVYQENNKFIHLLDCGYNSYSNIPLKITKYHRPQYILQQQEEDNKQSLNKIIDKNELNNNYKYEIINDNNDQHNTLLICDKEFDVGGKIELTPNQYNSTINLYNHYVIIDQEKQIVDDIWNIDARGPGN